MLQVQLGTEELYYLQRKRQVENYGLKKRKPKIMSCRGQRETSNLQPVRKVERLVVGRI